MSTKAQEKYKIKYQDTMTSYYLDVEFKTEDKALKYMQENNYTDCFSVDFIKPQINKPKKVYTLKQILNAFEKSYGENMMEEYPAFIKRLTKSTKNLDLSHKDFIER